MTTTDLVPVSPMSTFDLVPQAYDLAEKLARTEFVPSALKGRPDAIMACVLAGNEMGISPLQALQKIHIIEGRPGPSAELMRAVVLREGHDLWIEESTNTRVTVCGKRAGSEHATKVTWTLDDAKKAGLDGRQNWRKYPRAMLTARATSELVRMVFPDVLAGFTYSKEELEDGFDEMEQLGDPIEPASAASAGNVRKATTAKKAAPKRAAAKQAPPAAVPAADLPPLPGEEDIVDAEIVEDDEDQAEPEAAPPVEAPAEPAADEAATKRAQQIAMKANDAGVDRADVIFVVTGGRKTSAKQVDEAEGALVLEALRQIKLGRQQIVEVDGEPTLQEVGETDEAPADEAEAEPLDFDPSGWDLDQWRAYLKEQGGKVVGTLREAQRLAREAGVDEPGSLGDLQGTGTLAVNVAAWVEAQSS